MLNKEELNQIKKVYVVTSINDFDSEDWQTYNAEVFDSLEKAQRYVEDADYTLVEQTSQTWTYKTDKPWYGYLIEEFELK